MVFAQREKKILWGLLALWPVLLLALGGWWVYLLFLLGEELHHITLKQGTFEVNLNSIVRYEGPFFLGLLIVTTVVIIILTWRDHLRHTQWRLFFASLSHELRTPLTSINLQAEVLKEKCHKLPVEYAESIGTLANRLLEDAHRLEHQFNQILELARPDSGRNLPLEIVELKSFLRHHLKAEAHPFNVNIVGDNTGVYANIVALKLIFENLTSNTLRHRQTDPNTPVNIFISQENFKNNEMVRLRYQDGGKIFNGKLQDLGQPFASFNSQNGVGLGLYLVKKLMLQFKGNVQFSNQDQQFTIDLYFRPEEVNA